jgi:hypothetical protein
VQRKEILVLFTDFRTVLRNSQPIHWVKKGFFPNVKWSECEAGHLPSQGAEAKNVWSYTFSLSQCFIAWFYIKRVSSSFSFTIITIIIKTRLCVCVSVCVRVCACVCARVCVRVRVSKRYLISYAFSFLSISVYLLLYFLCFSISCCSNISVSPCFSLFLFLTFVCFNFF